MGVGHFILKKIREYLFWRIDILTLLKIELDVMAYRTDCKTNKPPEINRKLLYNLFMGMERKIG